ncbi:MAG TPA: 16S rRNA (cytosine(1402)-N(4))-methyltransferase RsmH [Bacteroidales bacterium]|nr:16S rRNA (cytosine(1402)-N(4))-methyltransferase RsmH [Bacteroidales bacterium]HQK69617.1 16S rRNA (cytosine(1402)-N(4))-methyltransferase RsmH [Bacteroidales bacterium]
MAYHVPALLDESIKGLNIRPDGVYVDATFGSGGHSREILKHLTTGRLIAFDIDEDASANIIEDERFTFLNQNYRFLLNNLRYLGITEVDGIIADLGVSFHQFDEPSRGFAFRYDAELDMRMSRGMKTKASDLLATMTEEELAHIFTEYGELPLARKIARAIAVAREKAPLKTAEDLKKVTAHFVPPGHQNRFFAKLFQALRIAVNNELESLKEFLLQSAEILKKGGRLVVITYHSLEDRLVKNFMKSGNFTGEVSRDFYGRPELIFRLVTKKAVTPGRAETETNKRARSAKLRVAEKIK